MTDTYALCYGRGTSTLQVPLNDNKRVEYWDGTQVIELANSPDDDPPNGKLPIWFGGQLVLVAFCLTSLSIETIGNLVRGKFYEDVEVPKSLLTQYDNGLKVVPDPETAPWAEVSVTFSLGTELDTGGQGIFRTDGTMIVNLRDRIGRGDGFLLECADDVDDAFRYSIEPPIRYGAPTLRTIGQEEDWWTLSVSVPFAVDRPT